MPSLLLATRNRVGAMEWQVLKVRDGDGDGFIHDGTPRQRPVTPAARALGLGAKLERKQRAEDMKFDVDLYEALTGHVAPTKRVRPSRVGNIDTERLQRRHEFLQATKGRFARDAEGRKRLREFAAELLSIERELIRRDEMDPEDATVGAIPRTDEVTYFSDRVSVDGLPGTLLRTEKPNRPNSGKPDTYFVRNNDAIRRSVIGKRKGKRHKERNDYIPNPKSTPKEIVGHHGHKPHGKSILWPAMYEHLRAKGMKKSKAAAISNAAWKKKRVGLKTNTPTSARGAAKTPLRAKNLRKEFIEKKWTDKARAAAILARRRHAKRKGWSSKAHDLLDVDNRMSRQLSRQASRRRKGLRSVQLERRINLVGRSEGVPPRKLKNKRIRNLLSEMVDIEMAQQAKPGDHKRHRALQLEVRRLAIAKMDGEDVEKAWTDIARKAALEARRRRWKHRRKVANKWAIKRGIDPSKHPLPRLEYMMRVEAIRDAERNIELGDPDLGAARVLLGKRRIWVKGNPLRRAHWRRIKGGADPVSGFTSLDERLIDHKPGRPLNDEKTSMPFKKVVKGSKYKAYSQLPFLDRLHGRMGVHDPMKMPVDEYLTRRESVFKMHPMRKVKIKNVVATQKRLNTEKVMEMTTAPDRTKFPLEVVRYGGKDYLLDGHHRVAAAHARGETSFRARVLDLDAIDNAPRYRPPRKKKRRQVGLVRI